MKIFDIFTLAVLNLYRRLSRTLLTVIGVVIGTACIVIMISIGLTNLAQFDEMIESSNLNEIEVYAPDSNYQSSLELDDSAVQAFSNIDNVEMVVPQIRLTMYATVDRYYAPYLRVIAVPADALKKIVNIEEGTYINPTSSMPQIIMGKGAVREFIQDEDDYARDYKGPTLDWLNTSIDMYLGGKYVFDDVDIPSSRKYKVSVVGIIEDEEEEYSLSEIYISMDVAKEIIQENYKLANKIDVFTNKYDNVTIYAETMESVSEILETVRSFGFEAYSNTEWIDEMQDQQKAQQSQLAAIGLISLIVSAIGIANTMMTSILERKKEIGVMKVIGVSINKIRILFLIEASLIGAFGGLIGVLIAHLFGYVAVSGGENVNFLGMYFSAGVKFVMPIWLDAGAICLAMVVGIVAGFFPARRATLMSPMEAIR